MTQASNIAIGSSQFNASGVLQLLGGGTGVTTGTGSGSVVLNTSPTLVTPILGTPTSGTLTNCTFPTLNQNTSGTAAGLSATLAVGSGGTGTTTGAVSSIQPVTATVASNALTVGINANSLQFRSATLTTGVPIAPTAFSALSLVVPSTATLGTVSAVQSQLVLVVLYNGGTPALGIVNISGGTNLDETTLLSTTAMTTGATSASVVYSASAITSSPFRVVGTVVSTQATAGTWATTPTLVQGQGGQAMASMQSLGFGQTWQNLTGSRAVSTTYYNITSKPILVNAQVQTTSNAVGTLTATANGIQVALSAIAASAGYYCGYVSFIVPPNNSYSVASTYGSISTWSELR